MMFIKECKKILFSLTFILYAAAVMAMYFTQFHSDPQLYYEKPVPGMEYYGVIRKEIPEMIMPEATDQLLSEYYSGMYIAYPVGFYKEVRLGSEKTAKLEDILSEITGMTAEEIRAFSEFTDGGYIYSEADGEMVYIDAVLPEYAIPESLTYERFRELMREADRLIGGGSHYSDNSILDLSYVPMTYEEAAEEYDAFCREDRISGGYARLFCDYLGIIVSILPVFVAAAFVSADKKANMESLIYSRKISSARLISVRFAALVSMLFVPVLLAAVIAQIKINGLYPDMAVDGSGVLKYSVAWLLPSIMTAAAAGMLLTEMLSVLFAVLVGGAVWIGSFMTSTKLVGDMSRFSLILRHNSISDTKVFMEQLDVFIFNRSFYAVLSIVILLISIIVYECKRKGGFVAFRKASSERSAA